MSNPTSTLGTEGTAGITEQDIANYLANTPGFFERHSELLASVQLNHPHGQRTVSLQERQAQMLREKIKSLERTIAQLDEQKRSLNAQLMQSTDAAESLVFAIQRPVV